MSPILAPFGSLGRIVRARWLVWLAVRDIAHSRRLDALSEAFLDRGRARLAVAQAIADAEGAILGKPT